MNIKIISLRMRKTLFSALCIIIISTCGYASDTPCKSCFKCDGGPAGTLCWIPVGNCNYDSKCNNNGINGIDGNDFCDEDACNQW